MGRETGRQVRDPPTRDHRAALPGGNLCRNGSRSLRLAAAADPVRVAPVRTGRTRPSGDHRGRPMVRAPPRRSASWRFRSSCISCVSSRRTKAGPTRRPTRLARARNANGRARGGPEAPGVLRRPDGDRCPVVRDVGHLLPPGPSGGSQCWTLAWFAAWFPAYAGVSVLAALLTGWLVDRFDVRRLLPLFLLPMAGSVTVFIFPHRYGRCRPSSCWAPSPMAARRR